MQFCVWPGIPSAELFYEELVCRLYIGASKETREPGMDWDVDDALGKDVGLGEEDRDRGMAQDFQARHT